MTTRWENDRMLEAELKVYREMQEKRDKQNALDYCYKCTGVGYDDSHIVCRYCRGTGLGYNKVQSLVEAALRPFKKEKP